MFEFLEFRHLKHLTPFPPLENMNQEAESSIEKVRRYKDGAVLIFTNAEALYEEAQLLGQAGHFARATVLHQISMEECSKVDTLG